MCDIGEGTPLICVFGDEDLDPLDYGPWPADVGITKGALYFCEEVHQQSILNLLEGGCCPAYHSEDADRVHIRGKRGCYCICQFKPLNPGDEVEIEETIKEPELV